MYLYLLPTGLIYVPFISLMDRPFAETAEIPGKNASVFLDYRNFLGCMGLGAAFVSVSLILVSSGLHVVPFLLLSPFALSSAILLCVLVKLPANELQYLTESLRKGSVVDKSQAPTVAALSVACPLFSLLFEYFRGFWSHGVLYAIAFSLIGLNLTYLYLDRFSVKEPSSEVPEKFHIPILSPIRLVLGFSILFILYLIIISGMGLSRFGELLNIRFG
jgi:hypothetical protein